MIVGEDMLFRASKPLDMKTRISNLEELRYVKSGEQTGKPTAVVVTDSKEPLNPDNLYDGLTAVYCNETTGVITEYVYNGANSFDAVTGKWRLKGSITEVAKLPSALADINPSTIYRLTQNQYDTSTPPKLIHAKGLYMYDKENTTWKNFNKDTEVCLVKPQPEDAVLDTEYLYQVENADYKNNTRIASYSCYGTQTLYENSKYCIKCDSEKLPAFSSTPYEDKYFVFTCNETFTMDENTFVNCMGSYANNNYTTGYVYKIVRETSEDGLQVDTLTKIHNVANAFITGAKPADATEISTDRIEKYATSKRTAQCYEIYIGANTISNTNVKINVNGSMYYGTLDSSLKVNTPYIMLADRYTEHFAMMEAKDYEYESGSYITLHHVEMMGEILSSPEEGVTYSELPVTGYTNLGIWSSTLYTEGVDGVTYDITYQLGDAVGKKLSFDVFPDGLASVVDVGLLEVGYDLSGKSPLQVLKDMLYKPSLAACKGVLVNTTNDKEYAVGLNETFEETEIREDTDDYSWLPKVTIVPKTYPVKAVTARMYSGANTLAMGTSTYGTPKEDEFEFTCTTTAILRTNFVNVDETDANLIESADGVGFTFELKITDTQNNVATYTMHIKAGYVKGFFGIGGVDENSTIIWGDEGFNYTTSDDEDILYIAVNTEHPSDGIVVRGYNEPFTTFFTQEAGTTTIRNIACTVYKLNEGAKVTGLQVEFM